MKLIACLSWFNESPSWLAACVASMGRICDHVVAVDGRYLLFPHEMSASPTEEAKTIVETAEGAGLGLTLYRPSVPFTGNEVEKRNLTIRLAMTVAEPMTDWLIVVDGDEYIVEHSEYVRHDLEKTGQHCAAVAVEEHLDVHDPNHPVNVALLSSFDNVSRTRSTRIYRCLPGLAYEGTHYSVGGMVDGRKVWLWGTDETETPLDLADRLVFRHRNTRRAVHRREQASGYYAARDQLNIEKRPCD